MKKIFSTLVILFLILSTTFIKNSSKKIEDEIFIVEESLRDLRIQYNENKLEHDYLSSSEKLQEYQKIYFDEELSQKKIREFKIIYNRNDEIIFENLKILQE